MTRKLSSTALPTKPENAVVPVDRQQKVFTFIPVRWHLSSRVVLFRLRLILRLVCVLWLAYLMPTYAQAVDAEVSKQWKSAIANDNAATLASMWESSGFDQDLLAVRADNGKSAFMIACKTGDIDLFEAILATGEDPESKTLTGGTPLMFATLGDRRAIVQRLLELEVDTDAQGSNGWSAMTIAAAKGYTAMIQTLASAGAEINVTDVYGWTPLMRAVDNGHWSSVLLLSSLEGIELDNQDEAGNTALHHAVVHRNLDMVRQLIEKGASQGVENNAQQTAYQLAKELAIDAAESNSGSPDPIVSLFGK